MNALILRRQSAANLRSVFFSAEVVVPDEAVKDELNRSLADAQGIASGIRFVTTQAWLDRMNHGSPDVSGRARALEWGIYAVVTDQAFLARPECARLKKYIDDNASAALWPLVSRIAGLFSTYFSYRADWLWNWAGKSLTNNNVERTTREATVLSATPGLCLAKGALAGTLFPYQGRRYQAVVHGRYVFGNSRDVARAHARIRKKHRSALRLHAEGIASSGSAAVVG